CCLIFLVISILRWIFGAVVNADACVLCGLCVCVCACVCVLPSLSVRFHFVFGSSRLCVCVCVSEAQQRVECLAEPGVGVGLFPGDGAGCPRVGFRGISHFLVLIPLVFFSSFHTFFLSFCLPAARGRPGCPVHQCGQRWQ